MMRSTLATRLFLLSMLIGGLDASTAMAAEAPPALVSAGHNVLEWTPAVEFESITLSLADPQGLVRTHRFGPGEAPVLSLFDAQGMPLPDGTYTWELRLAPPRSAGRPSAPLVQSGYFTIANGSLVAPDLNEPPEKIITSKDQMVPDDLIVDGKGCIGLGCANNEAFLAEALRLKQSVVRLRFEDTSVAAGLPARDWQLTVNDAASGGADRFSIDDLTAGTTPFTVRGGAPSNSLYVNGNGLIGIGTAAPGANLHLYGSATTDVSAGMGPDLVAGPAFNYGYSGASFGRGSGFFNVRPDAQATAPNPSLRFATANVERLIITNAGNVGIATSNPETKLHIFGSISDDAFIGLGPNPNGNPGTQSALNIGYGGTSFGRGTGFFNVRPDSGAVAPNPSLRFLTANVERMIIDNEGFIGLGVANPTSPIHHSSSAILTAGGTWQNGSSRDLKQDIRELPADEALSALGQLVPVRFRYKVELNDESLGFIAEDVPDLVATPDRKTLSPMDIVAVVTRVVQAQQTTIEKQQELISQLEDRLRRLEAQEQPVLEPAVQP